MNNNLQRSIPRRRALSVLTCFGVSGVSVATLRTLEAQEVAEVPEDLLMEFGDIVNRAEIAFGEVALSDRPDISVIAPAIAEATREALTSVPRDQVSRLVPPANRRLLNEMVSRDLRIDAPDADLAKDPTKITVDEEESCSAVVRAVLMETFGINKTMHSGFLHVLERRGLSGLISRIGEESRARRWARVTILLKRFLTELTHPATIGLLEKTIGKTVVNRILATMASRFVPVLGWIILAGALSASIYNNWERLDKCTV